MSRLGRIEQWNDERGYGFVRPLESQGGGEGGRAFVHIRAVARGTRRPADGDLVRYATRRDGQGRLNAVDVAFVNDSAMRAVKSRRVARTRLTGSSARAAGGLRRSVGAAVVALLAGGWLLDIWPGAVPLVYAVMSLVSFAAYARDKHAAGRGQWRTPESTLHLLDLLGGWPGGLLAQQVLRHKSSKRSYQAVFWCTVVLNCAAFAWLAGQGQLDTLTSRLPGLAGLTP